VELLGEVMHTTALKDTSAESLRVSIRTFRTMAANKFGEGNINYRRFGFRGMNRLKDEKLLRLGKRVIRTAGILSAELASEGLNAAMMATIESQVAAYDDSIDQQYDAISNRRQQTQERIIAGNAIYKEMMRLRKCRERPLCLYRPCAIQ